jgi:hypothetical protein
MSCDANNLKSYLQQVKSVNSEIESEMISIRKLLPQKYYNKPQDKIKSDKDIKKYLDHLEKINSLRNKLKQQIKKVVNCDPKITGGSINNKFTSTRIHRENINKNPEDILDDKCSSDNKKGGCDKKICNKDIYEDSTCPESDFLNDHIIPYPLGKAIVFPLVIIGLIVGIIVLLMVQSSKNTKRGGPMIQF